MRIERLSDNKIKVTLTETDLMGMNIKAEQLRPDSYELHTFLFNIMEAVKEETDFNPYNGQVVVEATPSKEGISIVISKISVQSGKISQSQFKKVKSITPRMRASETHIFCFAGIDEVCGAITELDDATLLDSALYKYSNRYYYVLSDAKKHIKCLGVLVEYSAHKENLKETFLKEHGTLIAEGEGLLNMAQGVKKIK